VNKWLALGSLGALVPVFAIIWRYLRRLISHKTLLRRVQKDPWYRAAAQWTRGAIAHFLGTRMRRRWLLITAVKRYASNLQSQHSSLTIAGASDLPLTQCYIPLDLRAGERNADRELIHRAGSFLVIGDPGSGKSALISRIVNAACQYALRDRSKSRLPVTGVLSEVIEYLPSQIEPASISPDVAFESLDRWFQSSEMDPLRLYDAKHLLKTFATDRSTGLMVLLDGLDELGADSYEKGEAFLMALSSALSASAGVNLLVVTARQQVLEFTPRIGAGGSEFRRIALEPFSDAAIYSFIGRWLQSREGTDSPEMANSAFTTIRRNKTLHDTCRNPLALTLYIERYFRDSSRESTERGLSLDTRAGFFDDIVDHLLVTRRALRTKGNLPTSAVRRERLNFFVRIAAEHAGSPDAYNSISSRTVLKHIAQLAPTEAERENTAHNLAIETGLLYVVGGTWHFIHQSFLDHFVALSLISQLSGKRAIAQLIDQLIGRTRLRYEEAFFLACGLMALRGHPELSSVLTAIGNNARAGKLYPRACLEAATYTAPGFPKAMRQLCSTWREQWKNDLLIPDKEGIGYSAEIEQLQYLVAVLVEYEDFCSQLGRQTDVNLDSELGDVLLSESLSLLEIARLDVELAARLRPRMGIWDLLEQEPIDDAIEALLDTRVLNDMPADRLDRGGKLAAIVAESALRSSWVARELSPEPMPRKAFPRIPVGDGSNWANCWALRGTRYGLVIEEGLKYLGTCGPEGNQDFPRLALLSLSKPFVRLRTELAVGNPRRSYLLLFWSLGIGVLFGTLSGSWWIGTACSSVAIVTGGIFLRHLLMTGRLTLDSMRALHRHPLSTELSEPEFTIVAPFRQTEAPRPRLWKRPLGGFGPARAAYWRGFSIFWRRFCPAMGDHGLPVRPCASLMEFPTEDIRKLVSK
jgi:hypothetical protein